MAGAICRIRMSNRWASSGLLGNGENVIAVSKTLEQPEARMLPTHRGMAGNAAGIGEVKIGSGKRSLLEDPSEVLAKQRGDMGGIAGFAKRHKVPPNQKRNQ